MPPRDRLDRISGACGNGKHGRCSGWMIVPNYGDRVEHPDVSVRCLCRTCNHPSVAPDHHLTHPPKVTPWR